MASRELNMANAGLAALFSKAVEEYKATRPGRDVIVLCTYRSPAEQFELFKQGRTLQEDGLWKLTDPGKRLTNCDGSTVRSAHNNLPSHAIDFAITINGKAVWDDAEYGPFGAILISKGLVWGGSWKSFKDFDHCELKA